MADDLISRSALLEAYDKAHKGPPGGARKLIEEAPEAVIRCKDCKHHRKDTCSAAAGMAFPPPDDWFCADSERR